MTETPAKGYTVHLSDNPHLNGLQTAKTAEEMLQELIGNAKVQTGDVGICDGCFWISVAASCILQAGAAREEHPMEVVRVLADTMMALAKGQTAHIAH